MLSQIMTRNHLRCIIDVTIKSLSSSFHNQQSINPHMPLLLKNNIKIMHDVGNNNNNSKSKSSNSNNNYYSLIPPTNTAGYSSSGDNGEQTGKLGGGVVVVGGAVFPVSAAPTIANIPHTMNTNVSICNHVFLL